MPRPSAQKRAANVSLNAHLIDEAKRLNVNISEACEQGLEAKVAKTRAEEWLAENRDAIAGWNAWIDEHGLPLEHLRLF